MKQLIVLTAVLPLMLVFMMQFTLDQKNNSAMNILQEQVYTAKEKAKQEGCFTQDIIDDLKSGLSERLNIEKNDVSINATTSPKYRINYFDPSRERGVIHYSVSVPVEKIMAGGKLFRISPEQNRGVYTVEGTTASEKLPQ